MSAEPIEGGAPKRPRRTPAAVRSLLLASALDLFATHGYAGTSTREIATKAGVSEALLFRHFGTKAALFEEAVVKPFGQFINDYVDRWEADSAANSAEIKLTEDYIGGLYDLLSEHKHIVVALVATHAYEEGLGHAVLNSFTAPMERLESLVSGLTVANQYPNVDPALSIRAIISMIMGWAVLDEWLYKPGKRRPARRRVVNEMTNMLLHGMLHRPLDDGSAPNP
jgi:AcrR family transcriptional regulator